MPDDDRARWPSDADHAHAPGHSHGDDAHAPGHSHDGHQHAHEGHSHANEGPAQSHGEDSKARAARSRVLAHEQDGVSAQHRDGVLAHEHSVSAQHKARAPAYAKVFVITCSDTRTEATDASGNWLRAQLAERGHVHAGSAIVRDEPALILEALDRARSLGAQVALLTGGTGISSRDSTFEAVQEQIARPLPGFGELFRSLSHAEIGSAAMLSRATAGVRADGLVIFAMPGSPNAVRLAGERLIFPELTHLLEELAR